MNKLILRILNYILKIQEKKHVEIKGNFDSLTSVCSNSKTYISSTESLSISAKTNEAKEKLNKSVRALVKKNIKTPEKLLEFVEKNGTAVHRIKFADKILNVINEPEGFIPPLKGFRALYLNLILDKKFKLETKEMFILKGSKLNIYTLSHQFHKWFGFKMKLSGFDEHATELFRKIDELSSIENVKNLSYNDAVSLKEAIRRDIEAIDFVINLSKENDGAKSALKNIKRGNGANI